MRRWAANVTGRDCRGCGTGDLTGLLIPADKPGRHVSSCVRARVLCGQPWFEACMAAVDARLQVRWRKEEGARMAPDDVVCEIAGPARALLTAERPSLNFLQLLSGVATATRRYVDLIAGTRARVLDTRKTASRPAPGAEVRGAYRRRREPAAGAL